MSQGSSRRSVNTSRSRDIRFQWRGGPAAQSGAGGQTRRRRARPPACSASGQSVGVFTISTRRFCARPAALAFDVIGSFAPRPDTVTRDAAVPVARDGQRAIPAELAVVGRRTDVVGVPHDTDGGAGVLFQAVRDGSHGRPDPGIQLRRAGGERDGFRKDDPKLGAGVRQGGAGSSQRLAKLALLHRHLRANRTSDRRPHRGRGCGRGVVCTACERKGRCGHGDANLGTSLPMSFVLSKDQLGPATAGRPLRTIPTVPSMDGGRANLR